MTEPATPPEKVPRDPVAVLRSAVAIYIAVVLGSGLAIMLIPDFFWGTVGGAPDELLVTLEGLRWAGGALTAFGVGSVMVWLRPAGQRTFVTTMALHLSLAAVVTAYSWIADEIPLRDWFIAAGLVVSAVTAGYLWLARFRARKALG